MTEQTLTIHQSPHLMPAMTMADAAERFKALTNFTRSIMREDIDYGTVPGTSKPTLLKPGAEKLTTFFGLTVRYELVEKVEDWIGTEYDGEAFFYYWFRCHLSRGELAIAEADGSCNSWESKYRYRQAQRTCPNCDQTTINRSKFPPRNDPKGTPGWYCYAKIGGCGANFAHDDPTIVEQEVGRIPNPNPADVVNTIKKMSQKRALVAATLLAVNASEFFTQDLEDLAPTVINGPDWEKTPGQDTKPDPPKPEQKPKRKPQQKPAQEGSTNGRPLDAEAIRDVIRKKAQWQSDGLRLVGEPITQTQVGIVTRLLNDALPTSDTEIRDKVRYQVLGYLVGVDSSKKLTKLEASAMIDWLKIDEEDNWNINGYAKPEVANIVAVISTAEGQAEMALPY